MTGFFFLPPSGLFGHLIDWCTHHEPGVPNVDHVAVVLGEHNGNWIVGEAWAGRGVRVVERPKTSGIFEPHPFLRKAASSWFSAHSQDGYDWLALPWMGLCGLLEFVGVKLKGNPFQSPRRWYCSEAAVAATYTAKEFGATHITPQRMLNLLHARRA